MAFQARTGVSRETLARLESYAALLRRWNRTINLVGRDDLDHIWQRHMLDSAQLLPLLPRARARPLVLLDIGSGAGFPGLVLAILGAGNVHLVERDRRKAAFLSEVARETATAVTVHAARIETLPAFPVDVVTARACAPLDRLLSYAAPFLRPVAVGQAGAVALFLKGRTVDRELTAAQEKWKMQVEILRSQTDPEGKILRLKLLDIGNE